MIQLIKTKTAGERESTSYNTFFPLIISMDEHTPVFTGDDSKQHNLSCSQLGRRAKSFL